MYNNFDVVSMFMNLNFPPLNVPEAMSSDPLYKRHRSSRSSSCSETPSTVSAFSGYSNGTVSNSSSYRRALSPGSSYRNQSRWSDASFYNPSTVADNETQLKQLEREIFELLFIPSTSSYVKPGKDIESEVFEELLQTRTSVPSDYTCHRCGQKGHWIKHCPTKNSAMERTPYQGNRPSIGFFRCQCSRHWQTEAVANRPQACRSCARPVYPHKMMPKR